MNPLPEKIREKVLETKLILAVIASNLAGTAFGFYYYLPQFSETPWYLWIMVADSPIATFLIAASFYLHYRDSESSLVDSLAFIANLKYGLWTAFVLTFYFESFWQLNSTPMYLFLLFSHLAMAVQAFLILDYTDFSYKSFLLASSWFVFNDLIDYSLRIHSTLPVEINYFWSPVSAAAISLTFLGIFLYSLLAELERPLLSDLLRHL